MTNPQSTRRRSRPDSLAVDERPVERVGIYYRVSDMGDRSADSDTFRAIPAQRAEAMAFLPRGADVIDEYIDLDVSGKRKHRPELDRLFADLRAGRIDAVLVAYLSRFGRTGAQILEHVELVKTMGGVFLEARHRVDTRAEQSAKVLLFVLSLAAELEWDRLRESLLDGNNAAVERGVSIAIPYGYRRSNGHGSVLEPDDDDEAPIMPPCEVVRMIYALRVDGLGSTAIARRLTELGVPTPADLKRLRKGEHVEPLHAWSHNSVQGLVAVVTYRGVIARELDGVVVEVRMPDGSLTHAPLVSDADWYAAQYHDTRPTSYGINGEALLKGMIRCASCSSTMSPGRAGRGATPVYRCSRESCPQRASIARALVEPYVLGEVAGGELEGTVTDVPDVDEGVRLLDAFNRAQASVEQFQRVDVADLDGELAPLWARTKRARDDAKRALDEHRSHRPVDPESITGDDVPVPVKRDALSRLCVVVVEPNGRGALRPVDERVHIVPLALVPDDLPRSGRSGRMRPFPLPVETH
jgi:DNA invertase Pin-like site-specific DNA recombinase